MCENLEIKNKDDFLNFLKEKEIKTVLLGNGFSLSHPEFRDCFKFKLNTIRQKLKKITKKKLATIVNSNDDKFDVKCPETSLEGFRKAIIQITIESYVRKFLKKCHGNNKDKGLRKLYHLYIRQESSNTPCFSHCTHFLNNFETIFTTNYDPLIYFEILFYKRFADGFDGETPTTIDGIREKHNNHSIKKRIYYLHGSWFIRYHKDKNMLSKLSFAAGSQDKISDIFNWEKGLLPYLIFEDRPWCKEHFIKEEKEEKEVTYFNHCFEALKEIGGPLLVFGMSFNKDDHIVEALKEGKNRKCYISYRGDGYNSIKKKFEGKDVTFVKLLDHNVIWDKDC